METTHNTSENVKPVTIITESAEEKDDDTENLVEKLQQLAKIVDLTQKDAQLVLIRENIFQKAANKILQLQKSKTKNTTKTQYIFLKNNPRKLFIIFNNFYSSVIVNNSLPNFNLIKESLADTKEKYYKNNFFDFETQLKKNNKSKTLIELKFNPEEGDEIKGKQNPQFISDYYVHVFIDVNQKQVLSTDYSKYLINSFENGKEFIDSFVSLNKKFNPFDIWNDSVGNQIANINVSNISTGLRNRLKNIE